VTRKRGPGLEAGTKSARTRDRILDAAAHVLSRKGFSGFRVNDVSERAGTAGPNVYYYFSSREELVEEVMWVGLSRMTDHIEKVLSDLPLGIDPMVKIEIAVEAQLRYELELSDYTTAAFRNAAQIPPELKVRYDAEAARFSDVWARLIRDAHEEGLIRDDLNPTLARMFLLGAMNWTTEWWDPQRGSIEDAVRTLRSLVRGGLTS
jgi:AcrR family transcriptional regulator